MINTSVILKELVVILLFINILESDCVDALSTIECTEAKDVGECENIDWAVQNCARTCDLCCGLC